MLSMFMPIIILVLTYSLSHSHFDSHVEGLRFTNRNGFNVIYMEINLRIQNVYHENNKLVKGMAKAIIHH